MSLNVSTAFKSDQCAQFAPAFNGGAIYVYSGTQPLRPHMAPTGTLLATITANGLPWVPGSPTNGITFTDGQGGFVTQTPGMILRLTCVLAGVAGWARLMGVNDSLQLDVNARRIDMGVNDAEPGIPGTLTIGNPTLTLNEQRPIPFFLYAIPPIGEPV